MLLEGHRRKGVRPSSSPLLPRSFLSSKSRSTFSASLKGGSQLEASRKETSSRSEGRTLRSIVRSTRGSELSPISLPLLFPAQIPRRRKSKLTTTCTRRFRFVATSQVRRIHPLTPLFAVVVASPPHPLNSLDLFFPFPGACFGGKVPASVAKLGMGGSAPRVPTSSFKPMIPSRPVAYAPKPPEVQFQPPPEPYYAEAQQPRVKPEPTSSPPLLPPPPRHKVNLQPQGPVDLDAFDEDDFEQEEPEPSALPSRSNSAVPSKSQAQSRPRPSVEHDAFDEPEAGPSAPRLPAKFKPMVPSFARAQSDGKVGEESPLKRAKTASTTQSR